MANPGLGKKLRPAKKALKRFAKALQTKFHDFSFSQAVEAIKTKTNSLITYCSLHVFLPSRRRSIAKSRCRSHQYDHLYQYYSKNQTYKNPSPIYIDQLYAAESASYSSAQAKKPPRVNAGTSVKGKEVVDEKKIVPRRDQGKGKEKKILYSVEDAWREVVAKSPQLRPVDERAEEFIYNFRKEIKLQTERSAAEYEEMLARSA